MSGKQRSGRLKYSRRFLLASALLAASTGVSGCATGTGGLSALNPLAKKTEAPTTTSAETSPGVSGAISRFAQGTRNQASSMGMAVKSAYSKGRDSVAGVFGGKTSITDSETGESIAQDDPLLLKDKPTSVGPEVFVANGQLWESTGNFERAMDNYSKALEKEPNNSPALASIARLHYRQQQYDKAVDFFQRAITASPSEAGLHNDLALTLSQIGRHDEAVASMNKAIELAPSTSRYANNLATVQFQAGREEDARATLLKYNTPAVAHYNMAYLQYSAQKTDKALQELGTVLGMSETAGTDSASQKAVAKSKELFEKLGGPTTQIAQSLPHLYGNVQQSGQAVAQLATDAKQVINQVRATATGATVQLSDSAPQPSSPQVPQATTTNQFAMPNNGPAPVAPVSGTTPTTNTGGFVMPDLFNAPAPAVSANPSPTEVKR